jgi:hypothetical protein
MRQEFRTMISVSNRKSARHTKIGPATVVMPDGSTYVIKRLLASGKSNAKLRRNGKRYLTIGLSLAPAKLSGIGNLCPHASDGCRTLCLNLSGRALMQTKDKGIERARIARARLYFQDRSLFLAMLRHELTLACKLARRKRLRVIARLNVLSDIDWARVHPEIIRDYPSITFYGYTKIPSAMERFVNGEYPSNYYLTFSRSETNQQAALGFLDRGCNATVVFNVKYSSTSKRPLPDTWNGYPVIDGDLTDLRFLDPRGVVVGLRAKGLARRAENQVNGFVVKVSQ